MKHKTYVFVLLTKYLNNLKEIKIKKVFYKSNTTNIIPSQYNLQQLSPLEELTMVGYPILLSDENNNLPVFRKGHAGCHPTIDF